MRSAFAGAQLFCYPGASRAAYPEGDYAYLLHIVRTLKSTGKGACILPHGVLFRGNAEADLRRNLVRKGYIKGIIGLPTNLFYGTGIPACIIVVDVELLKIDDDLERSFYEKQAILERWSVPELKRQKESAFFLRLAAGKDKAAILKLTAQGQLIEQQFLLELGKGFTFVGRQYRITV